MRALAVGMGCRDCNSLYPIAWRHSLFHFLLKKDMPSPNHCYKLWQTTLLLLSEREAHAALPCIALVLLVLAGFFSLFSWLETSPGEQKYHLFPYNGKTSLLWPWCRLGGCEIHGLLCRAWRWVCKVWMISRSRQGLLKACLSSSQVCKHKILAFPSVSFLKLLSAVLPFGNSSSWWCFPH